MTRLVAFSFFVWAAFDWPTWGLDRAGLAALGLGFLALAVGRVQGPARPSLFQPRLRSGLEPVPDAEPVLADLEARLQAYFE